MGYDEDISTNVTPTGPVTRARARQLNYQVLSFLANPSNIQEHMMLPKLDTFGHTAYTRVHPMVYALCRRCGANRR